MSSPFKLCSTYLKSAKGSLVNVSKLLVDYLKRSQNIEVSQTLLGFILIVFGSQVYFWQKYSFWSRRNVKTPTPIPFFGNFLSFMRHPRQHLELEWPKKYGRIYGFYMGTTPYLVCADANVLKKICIKDFDKFPNRFFVAVLNKYQKHFLVAQRDDHWRGMRALLTPTFSSGKIKIMYKLLNDCADDLVQIHQDEIDKAGGGMAIVDSRKLFSSFSMGSALRSFYGVLPKKGDSDNDDTNTLDVFARKSRVAFSQSFARFVSAYLLPRSLMEFLDVPQIGSRQMDFFAENAGKIIERRQRSSRQYNDYLQLLLEARMNSATDVAETDNYEEHHALLSEEKSTHGSGDNKISPKQSANSIKNWRSSRMKLTKMEVSCQAMMLIMVATETTATLLTHTIYLLAHHQKVQKKLYEELMKIVNQEDDKSESNKFDYEQITSCLYLDCVISESLRLMSPALVMDRMASEDYFIEEYNIMVPKGTIINLAYYSIHRDPEYWPEPEKFLPDRFMPENKANIIPGSYCPFGIGPRSCIGFRFALTEAKVALAKLLTEFQFGEAPGTKYPPIPDRITFILNSNRDLFVKVQKRS